ncbi:ImuA family protein [Phyllobacterium sp. K27]
MAIVDLTALRRNIAALSRQGAQGTPVSAFDLGCRDVDSIFRGGLQRGALHEVFAEESGDAGAATGFVIALALRASSDQNPILWIEEDFTGNEQGFPYAPGLHYFGLDPDRVIFVRGSSPHNVLKSCFRQSRHSRHGCSHYRAMEQSQMSGSDCLPEITA